MFEEFSSGYYLGRLYVEPYGGDYAVMQRAQHELVNEQLYVTQTGIERVDAPLVMKVDRRHFAVHGAEDVPENTLVLPESLIEGCGIRNPPALKEVLLAKADRARQLFDLSTEPATGT